MGIATGTFQRLIDEHSRRPFEGKMLTLGKQNIFLSLKDVEYWFGYYGIENKAKTSGLFGANKSVFDTEKMSDKMLFSSFGVEVESLDASGYEACDHVWDLNQPTYPEELKEKYDLVLDTGTFEHVFNVPNAFKFCWNVLKPGGRIIHMSPCSNYVDHGFYSLSPTLYFDFYQANDWVIHQIKVIRHTKAHDSEPYWVADYSPDQFSSISFGGLDGAMYQTFVVATKVEGATSDRVPQQRAYREFGWKNGADLKITSFEESIREKISDKLTRHSKEIESLLNGKTDFRLGIFGSGTHSSLLMDEWERLGFRKPDCFFESKKPKSSEFRGIPLVCLDEVKARGALDLIILSSHSSEGEMHQICGEQFPGVPVIRFWG